MARSFAAYSSGSMPPRPVAGVGAVGCGARPAPSWAPVGTLAGHVGHHEERPIARQVDDIEVVAAHGTQRLVERVDFVTWDLVDLGWLQRLLNLLSRELLGLELRLVDQFRCEGCVLQAEADVVDRAACPRESAVGLSAHRRRAEGPSRRGLGNDRQEDPPCRRTRPSGSARAVVARVLRRGSVASRAGPRTRRQTYV